ncbi:GNAT family N-acetyltransferase [Cloacibacterium sp.]|uniref:GNAT family N-acetyltransferase n=1 Tax=Cloacibacterium sp. TaxID=1913682 RepID=UPI0039E238FA
MQTFPTLSTKRLVLSQPTVADTEDVILQMNSTSEISENTLTLPFPYKKENADFWFQMAEFSFQKNEAFIFGIREKENLKLIGAVGLHLDNSNNKAEVGYWLGKSFWNKGYVSEALQKVLKFGFEELNLNKIYASHFLHNPASGKVLEKCGFVFEAVLQQEILKNGKFYDLFRYCILKSNY